MSDLRRSEVTAPQVPYATQDMTVCRAIGEMRQALGAPCRQKSSDHFEVPGGQLYQK